MLTSYKYLFHFYTTIFMSILSNIYTYILYTHIYVCVWHCVCVSGENKTVSYLSKSYKSHIIVNKEIFKQFRSTHHQLFFSPLFVGSYHSQRSSTMFNQSISRLTVECNQENSQSQWSRFFPVKQQLNAPSNCCWTRRRSQSQAQHHTSAAAGSSSTRPKSNNIKTVT